LTAKAGVLGSSDVSEIAICASYILYLVFYWKVFQMWRRGEIRSFFRGVLCPALATVGVGFIVYGSLIGGWLLRFVSGHQRRGADGRCAVLQQGKKERPKKI